MNRRAFGLLLGANLGLLAAGASRANTGATTHVVIIKRFKFEPETLEIKAGDTVEWVNEDRVPHTATDLNGAWDTGELSHKQRASVTFDQEGDFEYFCAYHPHMTATLRVKA